MFLVVLLSIIAVMPLEWIAYMANKVITLFSGGPIYMKIVPSTDNTGYFILVGLAVLAIAFIYYGKKLNRTTRNEFTHNK